MKKHGHHGGAWKVAYADFVTAMMALFLVLWLTAQDTRIKEAIQRAFRNPFSSVTKESMGIISNKDPSAPHDQKGSYDSMSAVQLELLRRVTEDLSKLLKEESEQDRVFRLETIPDGLRIDILDRAAKPTFEAGTCRFTPYGEWVFSTLAWELARYSTFLVELDGHTEQGCPTRDDDYGPWELSADRANAARRKLITHGVAGPQILRVAGMADIKPLPDLDPRDETNRRVTVTLKVKPKAGEGGTIQANSAP